MAWEGANRTALYALIFALFALWPVRGGQAAALLGLLPGRDGGGPDRAGEIDGATFWIPYFHEGRLAEPAGYANANTAMWAAAFWPAALLAGRREVPPLLRGLFMGSASCWWRWRCWARAAAG